MKNSSGMTMQQVQEKMNMLRDVFTVVRLLDVDSIAKVHSGEGPGGREGEMQLLRLLAEKSAM